MWKAKKILAYRFKVRKALLIFTRCKKTMSAMKIQRCYRAHVAWLKWLKEQLMLFYAAQRANAESSLAAVSKIQLLWRKYYRPDFRVRKGGWVMSKSHFARHVLLLCKVDLRKKSFKRNNMALRIQSCIQAFLKRRRAVILRWKIYNASKIWLFTKAYLLKLELFDRVMATRARRNASANKIKRNLRKVLWNRKLLIRFVARKLATELIAFRNLAVVLIQRLVRRKTKEYYMPLRKAARLQLKKLRAKKHSEFYFLVFDRASRICQKFGMNILKWNRIMGIIRKERRKLLEWRYNKINYVFK